MVLQTISLNENDSTKIISVDYGIKSASLEPHRITEQLGIVPSLAYAKGDDYVGREFNPETKQVINVIRQRGVGIWQINSPVIEKTKRIEENILSLLIMLEPQKDIIQEYLKREDYSIVFYILWEPFDGHGSYGISGNTLSRMSALCHEVMFAFLSLEGK